MKTTGAGPAHLRQRGILLVEAIVYLAVLFIIMGLAVGAFLRTLDHVRATRRVADDTARALAAGERWREDVRAAIGAPQLVSAATVQAIHLPTATGETVYWFDADQVFRATATNGPGVRMLDRVKATTFHVDTRGRVGSWRWELELEPSRKDPRWRPLFTFQAVPVTPGLTP